MSRLVLTTVAALTVTTSVAAAETSPTRQATAARAGFLAGAGAPGAPATICMVDTGVTQNPDTVGVVDRLAVAGDDVSDASPTLHGTLMAMTATAPVNSWGTVGLWPAGKVLSVRASIPGTDSFSGTGYVNGIVRCNTAGPSYGVKVILLALSSTSPLTPDEQQYLDDAVGRAHGLGYNVVSAAGNSNGAPVGSPANGTGVLSVGGGDAAGARCGSSATGADVLAPGCGLDSADPTSGTPTQGAEGSSEASAIAAAALSALRTYRPDLSWQDAENLLLGTARPGPDGPVLDAEALFRAAGQEAIVAPPAPVNPTGPASTPPTGLPSLDPVAKSRYPRPRIAIKRTRFGLQVRTTNRPKGSMFRVVAKRGSRTIRTRTGRTSAITIAIGRWSSITARFDATATKASSLTTVKRARRAKS